MKKLLLFFVAFSGLALAQTHTVTLTATPAATQPSGVTVAGYNFYQSPTTGGPYAKIGTSTTTTFTTGILDGGPAGGPGVTYFFVARAFRNPCGNCTPPETQPVESINSVEASALIPAPPLPPPPVPNPPTNLTSQVK